MYLLSFEWKRVGVMDNDSGDDGTDELRQFGWEEWEKEWSRLGWRNETGSLQDIYKIWSEPQQLMQLVLYAGKKCASTVNHNNPIVLTRPGVQGHDPQGHGQCLIIHGQGPTRVILSWELQKPVHTFILIGLHCNNCLMFTPCKKTFLQK